jgi:hypothetical protein
MKEPEWPSIRLRKEGVAYRLLVIKHRRKTSVANKYSY